STYHPTASASYSSVSATTRTSLSSSCRRRSVAGRPSQRGWPNPAMPNGRVTRAVASACFHYEGRMTHTSQPPLASFALALALITPIGSQARAQGCMPIRFVSGAVGGRGDAYLDQGSWRTSISLRRLYADKFFVGTRSNPAAAPKGQPVLI